MPVQIPSDFRRVIIAASVGNIIEWYDFYIFGSLAAVLSVKFFEQSHPVAALLSTIALFTAGFLIRPLGAFLFGWMGDRVGRKYTFLITLSGMGLGTGAIGLIPTYQSIGLTAAFVLFGLRMIQGLCLGGEYGGAITYVAEHVPDDRRGYYTGWLQTSPTLGIVVSLAVIVLTRTYAGNQAFDEWAWRVPFLVSFLLVAIAIYIRLQLQETPIFQEIKARGQMTRNPWKEAFLSANIKYIGIAVVVLIGQGVVWYSGQFWALYFLQQVSKVDPLTSAYIVGAALLIATPSLIFFGWLSDQIGRKPVILGGMLLAAITYYPLYLWLGSVTQPGSINYPIRGLHHLHPRLLRRDGVRAGRRVPGGILPRQDPVHVGLGAVPHRQWLGWRTGAVHHVGRFRRDRQHRLRTDLPDLGPRGVLRARGVPDAGDAQDQHLAADRAQSRIMRQPSWCRTKRPCTVADSPPRKLGQLLSSAGRVMPAIMPPGGEIAIGYQLPATEQDHQDA
ncbi:MFS family permease [Bradyrhizobium sp. GM24.11]